MSLKGRNRGKAHSDEESKLEAQAKGHREKPLAEEPEAVQQPPIAHYNAGHRERGTQTGFGNNQGKEGRDRSTKWGTRAPGGEHG